MKQLVSILILFISISGFAQNDALFKQATAAYNAGEYDKAIENYSEILENGQHSAALYFNLGNSHYKLNQIAPSIYYYEKALLLKNNDSEILNNLSYARNMTIDAIETLPENTITEFYNKLIGLFSFNQWGYLAIVFMCLFVLLYIAFYYFNYARRKRIALISSILALLISLISIVFGFMAFNDYKADQPAIVFADEVIVKSEPNKRSQEVFRLHEGTKLQVSEELNDWTKIQIADGQTGWLNSEQIKLLKDF
jgi:tetratricopeptide (TPR) repeat protein